MLEFLRDRVPRPTLRGWAFLAGGVALLVTMEVLQRREFAFVALFALALPVLGAVAVSLYRLPLTVDRRFTPELAPAGSEVEVRLLLRNHGTLPSPEAVWFDGAADPLEPSERSVLPRLRGFAPSADSPTPTSVSYELSARHRGLHPVGPLTVQLSDPFGMVVRRATVGQSDVLTVTPSTVPLPRGALRLAAGSGSAHQSRQLGGGGEQDIISRKYQTGDSMRRVNWSATARFGELMVRQDDQQNDQHAVVILDCSAASYTAGQRRFSAEFEWAVSMSTSIALHLLGEGFQVRLVDSVGARFDPASPDELLLHAARTSVTDQVDVDYRMALSRTEVVAGDLPPVFAVVGRLSTASLNSLAASARYSSGSVAIVVVPEHSVEAAWALGQREVLEAAGWMVQLIGSNEAPSSAWGTADGERLVL